MLQERKLYSHTFKTLKKFWSVHQRLGLDLLGMEWWAPFEKV